MEELKAKINELEVNISSTGCTEKNDNIAQLDSAVDMLNKLTNSLISESERAWEKYRQIEQDARTGASEPVELTDLRDLCRKAEQFATDLLCYSLGRFKRKIVE